MGQDGGKEQRSTAMPSLMDRWMLKIRVKRNTGELRHLRLAFLHDCFVFLSAELASIGANEHPIGVVVRHIFSPFRHLVFLW